jgi:hypothetical protein
MNVTQFPWHEDIPIQMQWYPDFHSARKCKYVYMPVCESVLVCWVLGNMQS